jgi:homoserine kinase type II
MAIYTRVNHQEIADHLKNYQLGTFNSFEGIIEGIDNTNFILRTSKGNFILTIFESRINRNHLPFFINFKLHLAQKGICCPRPVAANCGSFIIDFQKKESALKINKKTAKKSVIVTFLEGVTLKVGKEGYYDNITPEICYEIGKIVARLHLAAAEFKMQRENELGIKGWKNLFSKIKHPDKNLRAEISENLIFLEKSWRFDLPCATSHLDLFPDNVFFNQKEEVIGVIDFYFAADEALIYDFAIACNAWCFDEKNNFQQQKFNNLKRGYEELRKFSEEENNFLKIALAGAAMRFLLTRLYDMFMTPQDSLVKIKNPGEYLAKLRFFRSKI